MDRDTLALVVVGTALLAAALVAAALVATPVGVDQDASDDRFDSIAPTTAPASVTGAPAPIAPAVGASGPVAAYSSKGSSGS